MLADVDGELLGFCAPWLTREPRLLLACQFAPAGRERERFLANCVVVRELAEAAIQVSDRRVAEAKLAWWVDEATLWSGGHSRHPLARGLDPEPSARALASMALSAAEWLQAPPAENLAVVWTQLGGLARASAELAGSEPSDIWTLVWLTVSLRLSVDARASLASVLPMDLMARHGVRRSQWPELDAAARAPVLSDLARSVPAIDATTHQPALAALLTLERRWLRQVSKSTHDRAGVVDVFAAWRAARRAVRRS